MASKKLGVLLAPPIPSTLECCMCGDYGLAEELIRCKSCHFRSQHRYCSNLYPKAEWYRICNWCLKEDGETAMKDATGSGNTSVSPTCSTGTSNTNKKYSCTRSKSGSNELGLKLPRSTFQLHGNKSIKKQRLPAAGRSNVNRLKVRRYKLLEEVCN